MSDESLLEHYRMMSSYNRVANQRLYKVCGVIGDDELQRPRAGSFGSVQALLNHILLGDRVWMERLDGKGEETPPLDTVLYDSFEELRAAREREDQRIVEWFGKAKPQILTRRLSYVNSLGRRIEEIMMVAVAHLFNHQTHHRGQVHVMLSQTTVVPPSLDLHRIVNP